MFHLLQHFISAQYLWPDAAGLKSENNGDKI